ncbi:MAG: M81 family metallopeptidase, partial [Chloroflexota bacterium]|nr:M81 family metallopeptidase [Chloroflexota bacterium]
MRIALAGFMHESNSFLSKPTTLQNYQERALKRGEEIVATWKDAHHEVGGFLEGAQRHGFDVVLLVKGDAMPAGPLTRDCYETIAGEIVDSIKAELRRGIDGVYLSLHGAMVTEHIPDGDGETLARVRAAIGPDMPLIATLDIHGNVSHKMAQNATALVIYRSNPHLDQRQRGLEAAELMYRTVKGEVRPVMHLETPPLVINILKQYTGQQPALGLIQDLEAVLARPRILTASVAEGFPYADVEEMGMAFLAVADGDAKAAREAAQWMATRAWQRREELIGTAPSPTEALKQAAASPKRPVVLMDVGDNVGGGSAADSTILLAEALRLGVRNMLVILYDPESVRA